MLFEMPKMSKCENKVAGDLAGSKMEYLRATKFTFYAHIYVAGFHSISLLTVTEAKMRTFLIQYRDP